ncbi:MAG: 4-(cytidine 5'-diphospho)-2-C-methyl-D-erythritol kinase [Clostridia bacterium]|nr:4-(cytidine 5'-diphospho)-2-C-methyl-D-erythritol kinase [Clostridia bacterium]
MRIVAHAKINWVLDITGERDDGYHLMDMLMQPIGLADTIQLTDADAISLTINGNPDLSCDASNLAWKAAVLLQPYTDRPRGVSIALDKVIPTGAGLGGGSTDAAAVLLGLNQLWGLSLPRETLEKLALTLGADVPFFLHGGLCRVQGIGEDIRPISRGPKWHLVIIQPCDGLSTKEIFTAYASSAQQIHPDISSMEQILLQEDLSTLPIHPGNVLEQVSCQARPEIGQAAGFLVRNGAICAQMSGSGSAVFGVFENARAAEAASASARERWEKVYVCATCEDAIQIHA